VSGYAYAKDLKLSKINKSMRRKVCIAESRSDLHIALEPGRVHKVATDDAKWGDADDVLATAQERAAYDSTAESVATIVGGSVGIVSAPGCPRMWTRPWDILVKEAAGPKATGRRSDVGGNNSGHAGLGIREGRTKAQTTVRVTEGLPTKLTTRIDTRVVDNLVQTPARQVDGIDGRAVAGKS